ncbi:uncharacterized protein LOC121409119 [Lytechinus variegatus]|uniref:uncharacterized protein LOC121409119 n=1 Tax=Lytechinus variegatus TaxID=7654 RepID=UPI001BB24569|nr:uncharacterized protein LOC121409119 [Lytechinus variegatus]
MSSPSQHRKHSKDDGNDKTNRRTGNGGRSHSMPVAPKASVIQKVRSEHHHYHHYHHHLGSLKPLSWKSLFGKSQTPHESESLDEVDSSGHIDVVVDESVVEFEEQSSLEAIDTNEVRHTLKRASNAMVRPPSIHLIDVKITPEGEVETVLPVTPDEEVSTAK